MVAVVIFRKRARRGLIQNQIFERFTKVDGLWDF
jgi:hypothetical protein